MEFNTALLHQNAAADTQTGATLTPIYQVSAFAQDSPERLEKVFRKYMTEEELKEEQQNDMMRRQKNVDDNP